MITRLSNIPTSQHYSNPNPESLTQTPAKVPLGFGLKSDIGFQQTHPIFLFGYSTSHTLLTSDSDLVLILCSHSCTHHLVHFLYIPITHNSWICVLCLVNKSLVHVCIWHLEYWLVYPSTQYLICTSWPFHQMPTPDCQTSSFTITLGSVGVSPPTWTHTQHCISVLGPKPLPHSITSEEEVRVI